jgi:hypothetical protein
MVVTSYGMRRIRQELVLYGTLAFFPVMDREHAILLAVETAPKTPVPSEDNSSISIAS